LQAGTRPAAEELDLHRLTVEEAMPLLERFVYDSFQAGLRRVWVVHGRGSGMLRREVGRYLAGHALVKSFGTADAEQGGPGATQVELSDW
jgi:DNA mismatch repair protein MutS2